MRQGKGEAERARGRKAKRGKDPIIFQLNIIIKEKTKPFPTSRPGVKIYILQPLEQLLKIL